MSDVVNQSTKINLMEETLPQDKVVANEGCVLSEIYAQMKSITDVLGL